MFQLEWSIFCLTCFSVLGIYCSQCPALFWNCHHYSGSFFFPLLSPVFQVIASTLGFQWNCQHFRSTYLMTAFLLHVKQTTNGHIHSHWLWVLFPVAPGNFFPLNVKGSCFVLLTSGSGTISNYPVFSEDRSLGR